MTIHYHGADIHPSRHLEALAGRHFCVSFKYPAHTKRCHEIGQSVMLDNGAFSYWRQGKPKEQWFDYYDWCEEWLPCRTTWAVIPDVIEGTDEDNDRLIEEWPLGDRGAPVWHMHEGLERLARLCSEHRRICIGSSGQYDVGSDIWSHRMDATWNAIAAVGSDPWVHMLRGMQFVDGWPWPFASVDSTDVARNHHRDGGVLAKADRWDRLQCPAAWKRREQGRLFD